MTRNTTVTRDKARCEGRGVQLELELPPTRLALPCLPLRLKMTAIRLYPPLFEEGKDAELLRSGRTLSVTLSPRDNSVAVFATNSAVG